MRKSAKKPVTTELPPPVGLTPPSNGRDELMSSAAAVTAITVIDSEILQQAFAFLNVMLFAGTLPNVKIVYSRRASSGGHFAPNMFTYRVGSGGYEHELSLNPDAFKGRSDEWIVSVLLHEMVHLWQHVHGIKKRKRYSYHDREWGDKMESLGLMPSNSGMIGGKRVGQKMSHYVLEGGLYQKTFQALAATGWKLPLESTAFPGAIKKPSSKVNYSCRDCFGNAWAKPNSGFVCKACLLEALGALTWLDEDKANDLGEIIDNKSMLPPQTDIAAAPYDGDAREAAE